MRAAVAVLAMAIFSACTGTTQPPMTDAGADGGPDASQPDASVAPPADAGVPVFTAADFCEVFARTSCRWAVTCGQRTPAEEAKCVAQLRFQCPHRSAFNAVAAQVCLIRLESARCGPRATRCDEAWPASVADGGACTDASDCLAGVCVRDGGACGTCGPALALGEACDALHPCESSTRCADGDGGIQCRPLLADGKSCFPDGDTACASGRCRLGVCAAGTPGGACNASLGNAGCPSALYCDPLRATCRVPLQIGETCDNQPACAGNGGACLGQKCVKVTPFSIAEGNSCTETEQCKWGLACDTRSTSPTCVRRIDFGADCELDHLDVWDRHCPYLAMCHPVTRVCADSSTLCSFAGYCPTGPAPGAPCASGAICRGQSTCTDPGDGGFRCSPLQALPGEACQEMFGPQACFSASCDAGVCGAWPVFPNCAP